MQRLLAFILLLLISPIMAFLCMFVKLSSKGPFVFKQKRIGQGFKTFTIYKIRTMVKNAETLKNKVEHLNQADGPVFKIRDDPRFTGFGRFLSHTGMDEILQIINIIKGEMSFVGPRPLPVKEAEKVSKKFYKRFSIKPGITSLWIIKGAHNLSFEQWMMLDLEYIEKKSILFDIYIFLSTVLLMLQWTNKKIIDIFVSTK